jgi:hypothetical protein
LIAKNYQFNTAKLLLDYRHRVTAALDRAGIATQNAIKRQMKAGSSGPGNSPAVRTGTLRRSIKIDRSFASTHFRVRVGSALPYARIQEYGGTITGRGKKLAIPFPGNRRAKLTSPRRAPVRLVLVKRPGKPALLVEQRAGRGKGYEGFKAIPWYILIPSVKLPPRPYMRPGLTAAKPAVLRAFGSLIGGAQ